MTAGLPVQRTPDARVPTPRLGAGAPRALAREDAFAPAVVARAPARALSGGNAGAALFAAFPQADDTPPPDTGRARHAAADLAYRRAQLLGFDNGGALTLDARV